MKKFLNVAFLIVILLSTACLTNCKKDEPVTPTVTVVANDTCQSVITVWPAWPTTESETYLVADNPSADLLPIKNCILVVFSNEKSNCITPYTDMIIFLTSENRFYKYNGTIWQPL
jgi:hypothetical protein